MKTVGMNDKSSSITMRLHFIITVALLVILPTAIANEPGHDWRKSATDQQKIDHLVKVIPGASVIMQATGQRYKNLYWAAWQKKWQFAEYQIEEMQGLIKTLIISRPKRAATAKDFLNTAFDQYDQAIKNKDWSQFATAFEHMRNACMTCHSKNQHKFITLPSRPARGDSPVLDGDS